MSSAGNDVTNAPQADLECSFRGKPSKCSVEGIATEYCPSCYTLVASATYCWKRESGMCWLTPTQADWDPQAALAPHLTTTADEVDFEASDQLQLIW